MTELMSPILGTIISIAKGKKHEVSESPSNSAKRLIGIDDLRNDNLIRYTDDSKGVEAMPQDVLIAWDGANAGTIGFGKSGYIGSTIARLRLKDGIRIFTPFLGLYLKSKFGFLRQTATGATIPHINRSALDSIPLPDVDFDDQIRIAHLLGKVEGLITQRKQHLQQLDNLLKSVFLEMFGDPILNPHSFPVRKLPEFYINPKEGTKCGPFGSALKKEELVDSGVPVLNMDNITTDGQMVTPFRMWITNEKYDDLSSYSVKEGDIIISRAGTVGKMCVARMKGQPAIISTNLIRLRLGDELRPLHFVSLMLYCKGRVGRLKTGPDGAFTHMNTGVLDSLEFPYPPIELQDRFGEIVTKVEMTKSSYKQSLIDLEALYGGLSQKAFKGELDLSRVPLPSIQPEEEIAVATETLQPPKEQPQAIQFPDTDILLDALKSPEERQLFISHWLEAYRSQLGHVPFSVQHFMAAAQTRLAELHPDSDFELGASDYEHIKEWVFKALTTGLLTQEIDNENNKILLKARSAEWGSW